MSACQSLYGGQFTFINSVDQPNFRVSLPYRRSTTTSSENNPFTHKLIIVCPVLNLQAFRGLITQRIIQIL